MPSPEEKLQIVRELVRLDDPSLLDEIKRLIQQYKQEQEMPHAYANKRELSFMEWLKQYEANHGDSEIFLSEYGMTLFEFWEHTYQQERKSNNLD